MNKAVYKAAKRILMPFPKIKVLLKQVYRTTRNSYLRRRYPAGAFMICNGAQVFCDFSSPNYSWYEGDSEYLDFELKMFVSLFALRMPNVILDVGAHWGFYSAWLKNSSFSGEISKIVSIEADPSNYGILSRTLGKVDNITVVQVNTAISDKDGYIDLYSGNGTCKQTYYSPGADSVCQVQAISLDNLMRKLLKNEDVVTHVKLDIDGYEPAFFLGGNDTLKRFRPIIMTEFWAKGLKESGFDLKNYWDMLQANYYVSEACFPNLQLKKMRHKDLPYLIGKTMNGITNLVLVPKVDLGKEKP